MGIFDPHPSNITVERRAKRAQQRLEQIAVKYAYKQEIESYASPNSEFQCWEVEITFKADEWGGIPVSILVRWPFWEYTLSRPAYLDPESIKEHRLEPPHGWVRWGVPYFTKMNPPEDHSFHSFVSEIDEAVKGESDINYRYTEWRPGDG
jgi:hypothetical protein